MFTTRPMPPAQRDVLACAARHPLGRVPSRAGVHPATWSALADRMFIAGPAGAELITPAGRTALATGRTISVFNIWSMRWAHLTPDTCKDRATQAVVRRTASLWRLEPNTYFPDGLPLALDLDRALRLATENMTCARKALTEVPYAPSM